MKIQTLLLAAIAASAPLLADDSALLKKRGKLLFADDFNRADASQSKDGVGNNWGSNSERRAHGNKQVFLSDGAFTIVTAPGAGHGAVMFQEFSPAFADGAFQIRFRMAPGESFGVDFNDPQCKEVHSGHIAKIDVDQKGISIRDSKAGAMSLAFREGVAKNGKTPESDAFLKTKTANFPFKAADNQWHELTMLKQGDTLRVSVDGKLVGQLQSEGIAHPSIRKVSLSAKKSPQLDDLKVFSIK